MNKLNVSLVLLPFFLTLFAAESFAQRGMHWRGSSGWGMASSYNRLYNISTVTTVRGEVVAVDRIRPLKGMSYGVHLTLKADSGVVSIHLGPEWYFENQDVKIVPKDILEIRGSKVVFEGSPAIIAAEVRKGDQLLKLRDENGVPVWNGWRRK
jgi:hypothetical protein